MKRSIHALMTAFAAAIVAAGLALSSWADATIYRDCFEIIRYGDFRHVACTVDGLTDIHYAVDKFETNNWEVVCHGGGTESRIVIAQPGEHVLADNVFTNRLPTVTGTAYPFVFEFYNWYKQGSSGTTWYGYVSLGLDENAELVILESAITDSQGALTVVGTATGQGSGYVNPETGCETNCFDTVAGNPPHMVYRRNRAIDFTIDYYTENCWLVTARHTSGKGYVKQVPSGTYVNDSLFSEGRTFAGYDNGNLFFVAFKWLPDANDATSPVRYGWLAVGFLNGAPSVLASEMTETEDAALVGRGFQGVDDGPDEPVDGLIWRCNFSNGVYYMDLTNVSDIAGHCLISGDGMIAMVDDGRDSGRRCAYIEGRSGERVWFSVNSNSKDGVGERYVPAKWRSLKTSFKLKSILGCRPNDEMYGTLPESSNGQSPKLLHVLRVPGSVVNLDDKLALRYCDYELSDYEPTYYWQVNAGVTNAAGVLEARTVRLAAKERWEELTSPIGNWITVEIETVNDGSPHGLAYRIYIDGVLACSDEDGATVFRARPQAADRTGVSALGIGGEANIDDVVFCGVAIDPLTGIDIYPLRFGSGNVELTDDELENLAGIVGFEAISGLERIYLEPWGSGGEPEDAPKTCIDLGISPFRAEADGQGSLMLYFKNPTVVAAGIDPVACTVTGRIVPAEGTRIVQPPLRFMFGIQHYMDFGTPYAHTEEHGYELYWNPGRFLLDTSNYTTSNGEFTITYDEKFSEEGSAFFSLSVKDFR